MSSSYSGKDRCLESFIKEYFHSPLPTKIILAISGGVDSMVLAHLLITATPHIPITLVHVNGKHKVQDFERERFLTTWSQQVGLDLYIFRSPTALSTHRELRDLKYLALKRYAIPGSHLLLAHHLEDQIETLLLKAMRGYSPLGWVMGDTRHLDHSVIRRPLLGFSKRDLEHYAHKHRIKFMPDPDNSNIDFPRNYIRHTVMSHLTERFPFALEGWKKSIELLQEENMLVSNLLHDTLGKSSHLNKLYLSMWRQLNTVKRRWVLRQWLKGHALTNRMLSHCEANFLSSKKRWRYKLKGGYWIWKYDDLGYVDVP